MNKWWRPITALGTLCFTLSFFLPPKFYNAPHSKFHDVWQMLPALESLGQQLAYLAAATALCFAYVGALTSSITLLLGARGDAWGRRILLACCLAGGVAITGLGITLIATDDPWPAPGVRVYAAIAPTVLVGSMVLLSCILSVPRRWPALLLIANGMQVPLQFVAIVLVIRYHGHWWGYLLGAVGVTLATIGAVMGLLGEKIGAGVPSPRIAIPGPG